MLRVVSSVPHCFYAVSFFFFVSGLLPFLHHIYLFSFRSGGGDSGGGDSGGSGGGGGGGDSGGGGGGGGGKSISCFYLINRPRCLFLLLVREKGEVRKNSILACLLRLPPLRFSSHLGLLSPFGQRTHRERWHMIIMVAKHIRPTIGMVAYDNNGSKAQTAHDGNDGI